MQKLSWFRGKIFTFSHFSISNIDLAAPSRVLRKWSFQHPFHFISPNIPTCSTDPPHIRTQTDGTFVFQQAWNTFLRSSFSLKILWFRHVEIFPNSFFRFFVTINPHTHPPLALSIVTLLGKEVPPLPPYLTLFLVCSELTPSKITTR